MLQATAHDTWYSRAKPHGQDTPSINLNCNVSSSVEQCSRIFQELKFPLRKIHIQSMTAFLTKQILTAYEVFNLLRESVTKYLTFLDPNFTCLRYWEIGILEHWGDEAMLHLVAEGIRIRGCGEKFNKYLINWNMRNWPVVSYGKVQKSNAKQLSDPQAKPKRLRYLQNSAIQPLWTFLEMVAR